MDWEAIGHFIWSWLPIISVLTIYEVFFKKKFEEWNSTRNRLKFEKRLLEIDVTTRCFEEYREKPHLLFLYLLVIARLPLICLLLSFAVFFSTVSLVLFLPSPIARGDLILGVILMNLAVILLFPTMNLLGKIVEAVKYFEYPDSILKEREKLLLKAEKKKLISKDELEKFRLTDINKEAVDKVTYKSLILSK